MLKKIYLELVAIRKELHAIRSDLELKSNVVLDKKIISQAIQKLEKHPVKSKTEQGVEIKGITIDLSTHGIQQGAEENK